MDFGDVVVHIFLKDIREHYALERLWGDATRVRLPAERALRPSVLPPPVTVRVPRTRKRV